MILRRIKFGAEFGKCFAALAVIAALVTAPAEVYAADVARIGETTYDSLVTAFSSAKAGETVELLCDVDLANAAWTPVNLLGNFDGCGHTVSNLFIDLPDQAGVGFFSTTASGKWIRNVNFVNVDVTGLACVGGLVGTGCKGLVADVTVSGVIRIKATGGDDNGYARAGVIVGGWAYGAYSNVVVNGTSPSVSYVRGADRTIDGRYVAGLIGHADDVTAYFGCTVSNLLIDATYCSAGLVGSGPCGAVCRDCRVENVEITGPHSGALFGWMNQEGASAASGSVVNATICNVTFDDVARCGTVGGWDSSTDVAVSNVTVVGGTVVPYHYQAYVEVGGDTVHYPTILTAIGSVEDIEDIVVGNDAVAVPDGYELYAKGALWGVREITKAVEIVETGVKYASIESALLDISGAATIRLLADCTTDRIELSDAKNSSVTSLTIDLNGHVLTDNGGDALLTENRSIVIRDTAGAGVFEHTQTDDLVWIQGSQGGVTIESGVFRVGDAYGLAYASGGASAAQLVIRGGTFDKNPANDRKGRSYLPEGYASVDNGNGTWTVLTSYVVTFTTDKGAAPEATNYVLSATMTQLPKPTNQPDGLTFNGWLIPGLTGSYMAIPAGMTGALALTATWTDARKIAVKETEASAEPTVEIKVTQEWIDENVTPAGDKPTTAEIQTELNKKDENGNLKWQNYVIGLDPTNNVAGVALQNDDEKTVKVSSNVTATQADTGFTVKYSLDQVQTNGTVITAGAATTSDNLDIDLDGIESNAFFKVNVIVTKDDGTGEAAKIVATNTLGVLKVNKAPATSIVAVPWDNVGGTAVTVANYVKTASLSEGDQLYVCTTNGTYSTWALDADKEWYSTGKEEKDPAEETIARGSAVWVKRQDTSRPLVLFGQASAESSSTSLDEKKSDTSPSWNIVAAPTVASIDLNERFNADTKEGVTQDQVIVPTDGPPKNYTFVNGVWGYNETYTITNKAGKVIGKKVRVTDDSKIPAGTGFWYLNRGKATEVKW